MEDPRCWSDYLDIDLGTRDSCVCVDLQQIGSYAPDYNLAIALTPYNDCAFINQGPNSWTYGQPYTYVYAGDGDDFLLANRTDFNHFWGQNGDDTFISLSDIVDDDYVSDYAKNGNANYFFGGCGDDHASFDGSYGWFEDRRGYNSCVDTNIRYFPGDQYTDSCRWFSSLESQYDHPDCAV